MSYYTFQWKGYTGSIKGIDGGILEAEYNGPMAESCILDVVQSNTLRVWKKTIRNADLDGVILCTVSQLVLVIQNALATTTESASSAMTASIGLREEMKGNLKMELSLPHVLGTRSVNFVLEAVEQDEFSVLKQRINFLTAKLNEMEAKEEERIQSPQERSRFVSCGGGAEISRCGTMVSVTAAGSGETTGGASSGKATSITFGASSGKATGITFGSTPAVPTVPKPTLVPTVPKPTFSFGASSPSAVSTPLTAVTAVTEDKMKSGKCYAEFMSLRMSQQYSWMCGIVASTPNSLDKAIHGLQKGIGYDAGSGNMAKNDGGGSVPTGLPPCRGCSGSIIIGVHLDLDINKIQFFLNGKRSTKFDIPPGEYCFAVSMYTAWDAVKLLTIAKE